MCVCVGVFMYGCATMSVFLCVEPKVFFVFLRLGEQVNWVKMCSGGMPQIDKYMEISGVCRCQTPGCVLKHLG